MSIKVGRLTLSAPHEVDHDPRRHIEVFLDAVGRGAPAHVGTDPRSYRFQGTQTGAAAAVQSTMDLVERENERVGSVYVEDDDTAVPTGYYEFEGVPYSKPRAGPNQRPWTIRIVKQPYPYVTRQAEDDKASGTGTVTADTSADEASKVVYTPTTSEVKVLDPRNVAGSEKLNLPAGTYRASTRVQVKTNTSQKLRLKTVKLDGTVLTSGSQVTVGAGNNDAWIELELGTFTVADADAGANSYELHVQGVAAELGDVWIDRVRLEHQ